MKKIIAFILAMIMCLSVCWGVSAADIESTYHYDYVEIMFAEDSTLNEEMKQKIADYIINGDDGVSTYNLLCTLLGHKETIEYVATISHKVSPTHPRCLRQTWEVTGCTRCEEALGMVLLSESYITCCEED